MFHPQLIAQQVDLLCQAHAPEHELDASLVAAQHALNRVASLATADGSPLPPEVARAKEAAGEALATLRRVLQSGIVVAAAGTRVNGKAVG